MMYRLEITLPGLPETTNRVLSMRLRERISRKSYWKSMVWALVGSKKPKTPLKKARVTLIRCGSVEPDRDGLVSSFKHILDGLVQCGVLLDDRTSVIGDPIYRFQKVSRKDVCCLITVEELPIEE